MKKPADGESVADEVGGGSEEEAGDGITDTEFEEVGGDIPEPEWTNTEEQEEEEEDEEKEPLGGDNLQDLSPRQKRKAAEKSADALLDMYCKFAPLPFKSWASFSDKKVQKLAIEGKLDLNMLLENNVTVQDYITAQNESVEDIFEVDEETRRNKGPSYRCSFRTGTSSYSYSAINVCNRRSHSFYGL